MRLAFVDFVYFYDAARPEADEPLGGTTSAICFLAREMVKTGISCTFYNRVQAPCAAHGIQSLPLASLAQALEGNAHDAYIFCGRWSADLVALVRANTKVPLIAWMHESVFAPPMTPALDAFDGVVFVSAWQQRVNQSSVKPNWKQAVIRNAINPAVATSFASGDILYQQPNESCHEGGGCDPSPPAWGEGGGDDLSTDRKVGWGEVGATSQFSTVSSCRTAHLTPSTFCAHGNVGNAPLPPKTGGERFQPSSLVARGVLPLVLPAKSTPPILLFAGSFARGAFHIPPLLDKIREQRTDFSVEMFCNLDPSRDAEKDAAYIDWLRGLPNIAHVGMVGQTELAKRMRRASVLIAPNPWPETSCIALIEGLASGMQAVTTARAALPETAAGFARQILISSPDEQVRFDMPIDYDAFAAAVLDALQEREQDPDGLEAKLRRQIDFFLANYQWGQRVAPWVDFIKSFD